MSTYRADVRGLLAVVVMVLSAVPAARTHGQPGGGGVAAQRMAEGGRPTRPPPAEMVEACQDKKAKDACQIVIDEATVAGTCTPSPTGPLVCRSEALPEPIKACEDKNEGDGCSGGSSGRRFSGKCLRPRGGGEMLVCRRAQSAARE